MKLIIVLLALSSLCFSHQSVNPTKGWTKRITVESNNMFDDLKHFTELDIDIAGIDKRSGLIDLLVNDYELHLLDNHKTNYFIIESKGVTRGPDEEYKNPAEIETILKDFHQRHLDITELVSVGKSLEGRDIWAINITLKNNKDKPAVFFNSMHHAREIMTPEVSLDIIEYLLSNRNDSQVRNWLENISIWVMPMFNVDGNNKMWNDDSMWRKNVRGGYGVDLNRNYPTGWNACDGSSGSQGSQTYRGPNPASEPETQAMMAFIKKVRPVFDISYHSYSELVIYPFGCKDKRTQTKEVVEKIGNEIGRLLDYDPGTAWDLLYNADGGDIDWMYDAYDVIPYVLEVNSRWQGFHPKYGRWRNKTVERNRPGWMHLLTRTLESGIRGKLKVENNNEQYIEVYREGKLFQSYKTHQDGTFHLVLNPGKYQIKYKNGEISSLSEPIEVTTDLVKKDLD